MLLKSKVKYEEFHSTLNFPISILACQKQNQDTRKSDSVEKAEVEVLTGYEIQELEQARLDDIKPDSLASIEDWWNYLVFEEGGCLIGTKYRVMKLEERHDAIFYQKDWKFFLQKSRDSLAVYLISQLSDTTETKVHTCPHQSATAGEIAVYSLQQITGKMWYDIAGFTKYSNKNIKGLEGNRQIWLQSILKDEKQREKLADAYLGL